MSYNMTELGGIRNGIDLFSFANTASGDILFGMLMLALYFVLIMAMKRYDFDVAITSSSFICFVLSAILVFSKFLNPMFVFFFLIMTAFGILWLFVIRKWL